MYKKLTLLLILASLLSHCGFTPLHSSKKNINFSIGNVSLEGDRAINSYLKSNLKQFQRISNKKQYDIKSNTKFTKKILSKDKSAKISDYELSSNTTIQIILQNKIVKEIIITEKKNMNSMNDKLEEQKYERAIKQNFASSIANKLITELSLINDN